MSVYGEVQPLLERPSPARRRPRAVVAALALAAAGAALASRASLRRPPDGAARAPELVADRECEFDCGDAVSYSYSTDGVASYSYDEANLTATPAPSAFVPTSTPSAFFPSSRPSAPPTALMPTVFSTLGPSLEPTGRPSVPPAPSPAPTHPTAAPTLPRPTAAPTVPSANRIVVDMTEFLRFPKVVEFLVNQGIEDPVSPNASTAQQGDLLKYLPSKLAIDIEPARVAGSLGAVAATGYVAFNLYSSDVASWTIIMTLTGELKQVAPARSADAEGRVHWWCVVARAAVARARPLSAATTPSPPPPSPHTDPLPLARSGLKNFDEDQLLLVDSANYSAAGHAYKWDWRNDAYTRIGGRENVYGCHDIQWSSVMGEDAFWAPEAEVDCGYNNNVSLYDAATGAVRRTLSTGYSKCVPDTNHAQFLENDNTALLSLRAINAIAKYRLSSDGSGAGHQQWIVGGEYGTWPISDTKRGVTYPPGATVWSGQHNAEYMGAGDDGHEVWMFDDRGLGNESRLLIVNIDEEAEEASIAWEYRLGAYSTIYGDCDPTPAGNIYGSYWNIEYGDGSPEDQAQAGIIEVTRDTQEVAWHMRVYGKACNDAECDQSIVGAGWKMYSVERFFDAPVLPGEDAVSGVRAAHSGTISPPTCADGALEFTVFNSFKESTEKPGAFDLLLHNMGNTTRKPSVASGTFLFSPHWRPTVVKAPVHLQGGPDDRVVHDVELVVRNHRGVTTSYNLTCTSLDKHAGSSLDNTTNASRRA